MALEHRDEVGEMGLTAAELELIAARHELARLRRIIELARVVRDPMNSAPLKALLDAILEERTDAQ